MEINNNVKHFEYTKLTHHDFKKVLIRIGVSKRFGGIGVFAVRDLKKGSIIAEADYMGEDFFLPCEEFKKIDKKSQDMVVDFCAESEDGYYMPRDINYISIPWHMNHCCDGNAGFDSQGNFITIKNVKAGEELFYDYGFVKVNPKFKLNCRCKSKKCRGVVTGNDWKNSEYRRKNLKYMSPDVVEFIQNSAR